MEKYELTFAVPYWGPGGMPRSSVYSNIFEAADDQEAINAVPKIIPKTSITVKIPFGDSYELMAEPKKLVKIVQSW